MFGTRRVPSTLLGRPSSMTSAGESQQVQPAVEISPLVSQAEQRPYATIFRLALPVLVEQTLIFGVDLTDTYLSGWIGEAATEAICVAGYIGWMASVAFSLIGIGTTALVARAW